MRAAVRVLQVEPLNSVTIGRIDQTVRNGRKSGAVPGQTGHRVAVHRANHDVQSAVGVSAEVKDLVNDVPELVAEKVSKASGETAA
jgi:hypothetical protein